MCVDGVLQSQFPSNYIQIGIGSRTGQGKEIRLRMQVTWKAKETRLYLQRTLESWMICGLDPKIGHGIRPWVRMPW